MEEIGEASCSQAVTEKPSPAEEEELPALLAMHKYSNYGVKYLICQLPENPTECHRFTVTSRYKLSDGSIQFTCVCTRCRYLRRSYADQVTYRARVTVSHGFVIFSPKENHFHRCAPEHYKSLIKQCPEVSEEVKKEFVEGQGAVVDKISRAIPDDTSGFVTGGEEVPVILSLHRYNNQNQFFVCQLPQRPNKCYKFTVTSRNTLPDGTVQFTSVCTRCRSLKGHTSLAKYLVRVTDGNTLLISSPEKNHQYRCIPEDFQYIIKLHPKVLDVVKNKIIDGESIMMYTAPHGYPFEIEHPNEGNNVLETGANSDSQSLQELAATIEELPVEVWVNNRRTAFFVCKLPSQDSQEPQKCVKFKVMSSEKLPDGSMEFSLACPCRYQPANSFIWKSDGLTISRPLDNHLPSCRPVFYHDVVRHEVKEEVKQKILRGESIEMHLLPFGSPFVEDGSQSEEREVSMGSDLLANHPKVPELPVVIVANRKYPEDLYFICRLPDDPEKCLYFYVADSEKLPDGTMEFSVECTKCHSKCKRPIELPMRKSNGLTLSLPLDNHLPKCHTWNYERLIIRNPAVFDEVKRKILAGEAIDMHLPPLGMPFPVIEKKDKSSRDMDQIVSLLRANERKIDTSQVPSAAVIDLFNKRRKRMVDVDMYVESPSMKRNADWTNDDEPCSSSMTSYLQQIVDNIEPIRPVSQHYGMEVSRQMTTFRNTSPDAIPNHPIQLRPGEISALSLLPQSTVPIDSFVVKQEVEEMEEIAEPSSSMDSSPIPTDLPVSAPVRKIQLAVPKKFEKKFDAIIFTEDEVDISVNGNVLTVLFERKSSIGPSRSSHSLLYEHDLPDYVIVDSLSTSWEKGQLIVTAMTIST